MTTHDPLVATLINLTRSGSLWVLWLMIGLSVLALTVILERLWVLHLRLRPLDAATAALRSWLDAGAPAGEWSAPAEDTLRLLWSGGSAVQSDEARIATAVGELRRLLLRRVSVLGSLGANAPFIGLFGTVLGVIESFRALAAAGGTAGGVGGASSVMAGIAEALVATGVGLAVAIPCVLAYNYFVNRVARSLDAAEESARWLAAHRRGD